MDNIDTCDKFARFTSTLRRDKQRWQNVPPHGYLPVATRTNSAYVTHHTMTPQRGHYLVERKDPMKRTISLGILLLATLLTISGCNTVRGMGQDIEQGGEAIQRSAD